jgi:hypothetical protein
VRANLLHLLSTDSVQAIDSEIAANARGLFELGAQHYAFAISLGRSQWRQTISRVYYGAFGVVRSVRFFVDGHYSTETGEHKKVDELPTDFPNRSTYAVQLPVLRDDRNLSDYDHTATEADLVIPREDAVRLVGNLFADARSYLQARGLTIP